MGRLPPGAAGGEGAGRPPERTRARAASALVRAWKAGACRRGGAASRAWLPPSPTRCVLLEWIPLPCRITKRPGARFQRQNPSPAVPTQRIGLSALPQSSRQRAGTRPRPLVAPAAQVTRKSPRPSLPRREAQDRRSGPTCGLRARARARAPRSESFQTELPSGETALSDFFFFFFNLFRSSAPKTTSFTS